MYIKIDHIVYTACWNILGYQFDFLMKCHNDTLKIKPVW